MQLLEAYTVKYARKETEIDRVFMDYISKKGHQFESKGRTDKIASYLLEIIAELFRISDINAKKVVLYSKNKPKFDHIIDSALERCAKEREAAKQQSAAKRVFKKYNWEVPEERIYDSETNQIVEVRNYALLPFVQLNTVSGPEREFIKYLEDNSQYIDWWYKNGDKGKQHLDIEYNAGENNAKSLFYVDFIIRMKNGHIYLFDTKSIGSDMFAHKKHNALLQYVEVRLNRRNSSVWWYYSSERRKLVVFPTLYRKYD